MESHFASENKKNHPGALDFQGLHFLRETSAGYERVKRAFGPQEVKRAVEAVRQREQADKARQRPRRSLDRSGR